MKSPNCGPSQRIASATTSVTASSGRVSRITTSTTASGTEPARGPEPVDAREREQRREPAASAAVAAARGWSTSRTPQPPTAQIARLALYRRSAAGRGAALAAETAPSTSTSSVARRLRRRPSVAVAARVAQAGDDDPHRLDHVAVEDRARAAHLVARCLVRSARRRSRVDRRGCSSSTCASATGFSGGASMITMLSPLGELGDDLGRCAGSRAARRGCAEAARTGSTEQFGRSGAARAAAPPAARRR